MADLSEEDKKLLDKKPGIGDVKKRYENRKDELNDEKKGVQKDIDELARALKFIDENPDHATAVLRGSAVEKLQERNQKLADINEEIEKLKKNYAPTGAIDD